MNDSPTYYEAVKSLIGSENCGGGLTDGPLSEIIILNGVTPPTENTIQTKLSELQAEWDSLEYARNRAEQYPELTEQLDLLWHAIDTGTLDDRDHRNKFYSMLKQVKENNPKG